MATLVGSLLIASMLAAPFRLATGILGSARHLRRADAALSDGAFKRARRDTLQGGAAAERAARALGPQPLLDLARAVPRVAALLEEVPHITAAAQASAAAARGSLEVAQGALRGPDKIVVTTEEGVSRVRLDRVADLARLVGRVRAGVRTVRAQLLAVDPHHLPARARKQLRSGVRRAEAASVLLSDALAGFRLLPGVLGADGPRSYLVAMQNSGELRGTGGSLLRFSLLEFDDGVPRLRSSKTVYKVDTNRQTLDIPLPPGAWYVAGIEDAQRFGNANWSPDWPLSARLSLRYARAGNPEFPAIDGVVAVDPMLMRELMPGVGQFLTKSRKRITQQSIVPFVLHDFYGKHPNPGLRRMHLKDIVDRFYAHLLHPAHPTDLIAGMGAGLVRKHMQIYVTDDAEEAFVEHMNWDGGIEDGGGDYLYVVEQNVGGNKLDYSARQTDTMNVSIEGSKARVTTKVRVDNDVVLPQSNYWLGNSGPCHRPMINVYVPARAHVVDWSAPAAGGPPQCSSAVRRLDTPEPAVWAGGVPPEHLERGRKALSATLEIPPGRSGAVGFDYVVPRAVTTRNGRSVYRLVLQRQPKVWPDAVTVRLHLPRAARAVRAPGWRRKGSTLVWERALTSDVALEVSWL